MLDLIRVGDVATDRRGGTTWRRDELHGLLQTRQSLAEHGYLGPVACQAQRDGAADA
jgi:hypothetical protein